jgi:heterodisulfide reductase subunit C
MDRERVCDQTVDLYEQVDTYRLVPNLRDCLQCGKCSGGCPVAAMNPSYNPRQIIRDVLAGREERWLDSEEIWRCFWCANCYMGCPADIHFPLLMMQLRYRALQRKFGLKYIFPFKLFALRAREDGLTFVPLQNRDRIMKIRSDAGMAPWPEISDKAREEYKAMFDLTGTTDWVKGIRKNDEQPVRFAYLQGRIVHE